MKHIVVLEVSQSSERLESLISLSDRRHRYIKTTVGGVAVCGFFGFL